MTVSRGFAGRRRGQRTDLPPGQYDAGREWPVLTAEVTPHLDPQQWTMSVDGLVNTATTWSWDQMHALPQSDYEGPIH
jgi:DMSO/TMAO reductase YedYZ molybdopterin-dependent catalytic subunit